MAETKHKKRGSIATLLTILVVLVGITAAIVMWPTETEPTETTQNSETDTEEVGVEDEVAAATLIFAGDKAPDFSVQMLDGSRVILSRTEGKPTLLIFWATWCSPCREELAHLQEGIIDVYGDSIRVLPISRGEKREVVEAFINQMGYTFNVGIDPDQKVYNNYATNFIPRCFVIEANGNVLYSGVGYDESVAQEVRDALDAALAKKM